MNLPDHGRHLFDDIIRPEMIEVAVCDCQRAMSKLLLDDADIHVGCGQFASSRVPKAMHVDTSVYAPEYRMTCGEFSHVACMKGHALVAREEETIVIVGPGGYPAINLPSGLCVNSSDPALSTLSFEYSDGTVFRIDVTHSQREDLKAP